MLSEDHLALRWVRLKSPEEWVNKQPGLSFVFPREGAGICSCEPLNERVAAGDVLVLDGAVAGKLRVPPRGELGFACFSVRLEHLFPLFASDELCLLQDVAGGFKRARLYPASQPLAAECHRLIGGISPQFNLDHRSQLLRAAAAILTVEFKNAHGQRAGFIRPEDHVTQVFEKLSTADLLDLSVPELANRFGCGRRHLNRLFHQHFGVSVAALRMELRLLKAAALLRNPEAKVINVAGECGFNHLGLFNTCFKRRFGTTPGHWRGKALPRQDPPAGLGAPTPNCPLRINGLCPWTGQPGQHEAVPQPPAQAPSTAPLLPARPPKPRQGAPMPASAANG